jgi:SAM-dependent methyltransferase
MAPEPWGRRPRDWAELAEPSNAVLFQTVLRKLGVGPATRLLDIGCGSGYAAAMAQRLGADVTGLDITPELLAIARERVPSARFVAGDMDDLPFDGEEFDVAVAFNAFQFARDPLGAVREAGRVIRPGGAVAATTFAEAERNQSTALHLALEPLRNAAGGDGPRRRRDDGHRHLPYALSEPGGLEALADAAGLELVEAGEVPVTWAHPTVGEAIRAVLASGGGALAIDAAGVDAAHTALEAAVGPFVRGDGGVAMDNVFRFAIARRS